MIKRILLTVALAAALAGCSALGPVGAILSGNTSNPVTPKMALQLHNGFVAAVVIPAAAYNKLPRCTISTPPCSNQAVVTKLRTYVNAADATLKQLDAWAVGNTKLDGPALYKAATIAIATAKDFAAANGVK